MNGLALINIYENDDGELYYKSGLPYNNTDKLFRRNVNYDYAFEICANKNYNIQFTERFPQILNCRICGKDGGWHKFDGRWAIFCNQCSATTGYCDTQEGAINNWEGRIK